MAWTLLVGTLLTTLVGWWWIDSLIALALVYFVVKEGLEAVQEAKGVSDNCCSKC